MGHDVTPAQVVAHRVRVQQLDVTDNDVAGAAVLDLGVQDTGTGGALWALAARGAEPPDPGDLALAWTLRGAPTCTAGRTWRRWPGPCARCRRPTPPNGCSTRAGR